jgi:hypothetical protein
LVSTIYKQERKLRISEYGADPTCPEAALVDQMAELTALPVLRSRK